MINLNSCNFGSHFITTRQTTSIPIKISVDNSVESYIW